MYEAQARRLVVRGRSKAEIADALSLGEATAMTRVANILTRFGRRDRLQAVVFADETSFVRPAPDC